jgi:hypothetical protein
MLSGFNSAKRSLMALNGDNATAVAIGFQSEANRVDVLLQDFALTNTALNTTALDGADSHGRSSQAYMDL